MAEPVKIGDEFQIDLNGGQDGIDPFVTQLVDGRMLVTYSGSSIGTISAQILNPDGSKWGTEFKVTTSGGGNSATATSLSNGGYVIAWQEADRIKGSIYNADGSIAASELLLSSEYGIGHHDAYLETFSNGDFVLSHTLLRFSQRTFVDVFSPDGANILRDHEVLPILNEGPNPEPGKSPSDASLDVVHASTGFPIDRLIVAADFEGYIATTAYDRPDLDGEAPLSTVESWRTILNVGGPIGHNPEVAALANGTWVVVWEASPESSLPDIYGAVINTDRTILRSFNFGNTNIAETQPTVAALPDGRFVVAYVDGGIFGDPIFGDQDIFVQTFNANGTLDGGPVPLTSALSSDVDQSPSIEVMDDGRFLVASQRGNASIWGQIFSAAHQVDGTIIDNPDLQGTAFADVIRGFAGADTMAGLAGNDSIIGGEGIDVVSFLGPRSEYLLHTALAADGVLRTTVTHLGGAGIDGQDILEGVERLQFTDLTAPLIGTSLNASNDLDGDGRADIVFSIAGATYSSNYAWHMNDRSIAKQAAVDLYDKAFSVQLLGDFDGDGKTDALFQQPNTGGVYAWLLDGAKIKAQGAVDVGDPGFHLLGTADFDGNGTSDLLLRNDAGFVYMWTMNGLHNTPLPVQALDPSWHVQGAGDFDGDGKADILLRNIGGAANENGAFFLWKMDGNIVATQAQGSSGVERPGTDWQTLGLGDFDGDGKTDFAVRHVSDFQPGEPAGAVWVYLMDGTTIKSQGPAGIADAAQFHVQQITDLSGDGRDDILFRSNAGYFYSWDMDGTTIASEGAAGTQAGNWADPNFQVVTQHWDLV